MFKKIYQIAPLLLVILLSFTVIIPYFRPGFFPTHDGGWVPVRLAEMVRELKDLQIPPRMSGYLNHGYGYPLFNFAYPFPYYLGTIFYLLGFGLVGSTKLLFALTVPLSGIFMYFLAKELWKSKLAGLISAVFYIFLPYRIVDLYARGSVGESLSFALFPLLLLLVFKKSPFLSLAFAILITTHNIMAVLFLPLIIIFAIIYKRNIIFSLLLGFGLSAYFWLSALLEKNTMILSKIPIADRSLYFLNLPDLVLPKWGYGLPTNPDGFGYQLGWSYIIAFVLTLIEGIRQKSKIIISLSLLTLVLAFLLFPPSNLVWHLPLLKEINYPWTLLAPIGFLVSLLAGFLAKTKILKYGVLFLALLTIVYVFPHARPMSYLFHPDEFYQTNDATTTSSDELMPIWVQEKPSSRPEHLAQPLKGEVEITTLKDSSDEIVFEANAKTDAVIQVNRIFYYDWDWLLNGKKVPAQILDKTGLMSLEVEKGQNQIIGKFSEPPLRKFSNILSLLSLVILLALLTVKLRPWRA